MKRNAWINSVMTFTIGWIIALTLWRIIRQGVIKPYFESLGVINSPVNTLIFLIIISNIAGFTFGSVQYYTEYHKRKKKSFRSFLIRGLILHILIMFLLYLLVYLLMNLKAIDSYSFFNDFLLNKIVISNFIYSIITNSVILLLIQINKLFGKGNLWKFATGRFYVPKEEYRVFMFLDLQSSTAIAETLGHVTYSGLIQDCFYDLSSIEKSKAEIYQYVGDEAVLTWKVDKGSSIDHCIEAFFLYKEYLNSRSDYYISKYNIKPSFKAGIDLGEVTVAEVGSLKKEIAYHGNTLNIASRIQGQCKVFKKELLISHSVREVFNDLNIYEIEDLGSLKLRGKNVSTSLYSVIKKSP